MSRKIYLLFIIFTLHINNVQSQKYVVGGDFDYAPYSFIDKTGKACGMDIDILNAIANETGITFDYRLSKWDSALTYIQSGETDIITSIIFSEEREDFVDFTYPIHTAEYAVFIHKDLKFKEISDLYDYKLMVLNEDISIDRFLIPMGLYKNYIEAKSLPEALAGVEWGSADYVIAPYSVGMNEIVKNKYENIEVKGPAILPSIYCLAVNNGNTHLLGILNKGISELRANGEFQKIKDKWMVYERDDTKYKTIAKYIGIILIIAIVLFILIFIWVRQLRVEIRKSTKKINIKNRELRKLNAEKDKFFAIISHDLKSPFNSMLGFSNMLEDEFDELNTEQKRKFIHSINQGLKNTYKLLENLLYWSSSHSGNVEFKPVKIDLNTLCNEINKLLIQSAEKKSIHLISQIPENINIEADIDMLSTIIRNLLSNAIKFTPKEGEISINAKLRENKKFVEISIKDNGVGISKETQSKLFDIGENKSTYGTENEAGTGLGLILCKEFVEKHKGEIWVKSEIGKGSEFSFTIPHYVNKNS